MKTIEIENLNSVLVDGQQAGRLVDVIWNHPDASQLHVVQGAVDAYAARAAADVQGVITAANQAATDATEATKAERAAHDETRKLRDEALGQVDALKQANAELNEQVAALSAKVAALGGSELAQKLAREQRIAELTKRQEAAAAELAALSA